MKPQPDDTHAAELARRARGGCALAIGALVGLRFAMDAYSGPRVALGVGITAAAAVAFAAVIASASRFVREALYYAFARLQ